MSTPDTRQCMTCWRHAQHDRHAATLAQREAARLAEDAAHPPYPCAYCGMPFRPEAFQRSLTQRGMRLYCSEAHRLASYWGNGAAWDGPQLACCGIWSAITTVPFQAPCCQQWYFLEDKGGKG